MAFGRNSSDVEPISAPCTVASPTCAAAFTAARCWRISPGRARPARMPLIRNGVALSNERASEERSTWPPPSPIDPSITNTARLPFHTDHLAQRMLDVYELTLRVHHVINRLVGRRGFVDHVGIFAAFDTLRRARVVFEREGLLRRRARHFASRTV